MGVLVDPLGAPGSREHARMGDSFSSASSSGSLGTSGEGAIERLEVQPMEMGGWAEGGRSAKPPPPNFGRASLDLSACKRSCLCKVPVETLRVSWKASCQGVLRPQRVRLSLSEFVMHNHNLCPSSLKRVLQLLFPTLPLLPYKPPPPGLCHVLHKGLPQALLPEVSP